PDRPGAPYGTWSVGVDGSGARLLAAGVGQAHVSPDGRRLVGVDRVGIVTVDLRTGARKHLTAHVIAAQPAWSPDGRMIVYSSSYLEQGTPYQEITTM